MQPTICNIPEKQLLGSKQTMNLVNNTTGELWTGFAPHIKGIQHNIG